MVTIVIYKEGVIILQHSWKKETYRKSKEEIM